VNEGQKLRQALAQFAKNSKLFALLDQAGLELLAQGARTEEYDPDETVVVQGELGTTFYLIASGEVRVLLDGTPPREVARLGPGMFFGEIGVMTNQPRTATVETTTLSQLICFERDLVAEILRDYPLVKEVLGGVGLMRSEANLQTRATMDDDGGLADLLEDSADEDADDEEQGAADDVDIDIDIDDSEPLAPPALEQGRAFESVRDDSADVEPPPADEALPELDLDAVATPDPAADSAPSAEVPSPGANEVIADFDPFTDIETEENP
jgi:CRP-like cAMP-binding protein